jgi:hypothetical protein
VENQFSEPRSIQKANSYQLRDARMKEFLHFW